MKKLISTLLAVGVLLSMAVSSYAAPAQDITSLPLTEIDIENYNISNPNPELGTLIEHTQTSLEDGSVLHEYTYRHPQTKKARSTFGTDTFTKTGLVTTLGHVYADYYVTATFDWSSSTKKVHVYNEDGGCDDYEGAKISNEKTTTSGDNTSKASATYTFTRTTQFGAVNTRSIKISCNYKGTNS